MSGHNYLTGQITALICASLVAACSSGPRFQRPALPAGTDYGRAVAAAVTGAPVASLGTGPSPQWWAVFGSAELNALVERALTGNQSLQVSNATLERARERIVAAAGRRQPQAEVAARVEREQVNLAAFGFDPALLGDIGNPLFNLYSIGGGVSYDLDLRRMHRSALEQTLAEAEAQQHQTEAAHLTIAGRVVTQALSIAAIRARIATTRVLLEEDRHNLTLTESRRRAGAGTLVEVLSAQSQLASDAGDLPQLEQRLVEARDLLAVLLGVSPAELGMTEFELAQLHLPASLPVALPSALVHRRPDILQAEAELHAATAAIGVANARLYPDVTLGFNFSQAAPRLGDVAGAGFRGYDWFASLSASLFDGGSLRAARRGAEAEARAAAARYRQTVLEAFGQVTDLLAAIDNDARTLIAHRQAAELAARLLELSRRSFAVGNSDVLQVLDANRAYQRARLAQVDAEAYQLLNVMRLYAATAGGASSSDAIVSETH